MPVRPKIAVIRVEDENDHIAEHKTVSDDVIHWIRSDRTLEVAEDGTLEQRLIGADALVLVAAFEDPQTDTNPWLDLLLGRDLRLPDIVLTLAWGRMEILTEEAEHRLFGRMTRLRAPHVEHFYRVLRERGVFRDAAIAGGPW